ncbi:hypothetical protein CYMTET_33567 [Cymbomonas tetramitiformis]|uniref:Rab-GAP TBC domain-containing protein n=1 Tax=Cymbomonas tetramitiformis TaxID=36881 RepID=A0AAE0KQU2_9CHLO|nr:hypothetical protein CYMTET_33567 [Cymbomonas tetramitiformis]
METYFGRSISILSRSNDAVTLEKGTDEYGFTLQLTPEQAKSRQNCLAKQQTRTAKWIKFSDPIKLRDKSRKLKNRVRKGIPPVLRPSTWYYICGANMRREAAGRGYYENILQDHAGEHSKITALIDLDLPRTFPENAFISGPEGTAQLRRVLRAFSFHNTHIRYCQSMNYIAGILLLVLKDDEKAFWVLVVLIEDILYPNCHAETLEGCHVEQRTLKALLELKMPRLSQHFDELMCDLSCITTEWVLCLFTKSLPAETVCRVLDSILLEGSKVLFRISLAIFKMTSGMLMNAEHIGMSGGERGATLPLD